MFRTIVVGTDGSATADVAVTRAAELAALCGSQLHIVSAYTPKQVSTPSGSGLEGENYGWVQGAESEVDATLDGARRLATSKGAEAVTHAERGDPADVVLEVAKDVSAELVVVGNKGMQRRILGSVPNTISHRADCDVLIIHTT
jgi:nucleotide-binding universal stress UspA family protein